MQIIDADESRLIVLPGVGKCPRPVDIDQSVTGFTTLKSLRIYRFQPGATIEGESEEDEVFVLPVSGGFHIEVTGKTAVAADLTAEGPVRALYMTPHHAYRLTPGEETLVAYARAEAGGRVPVQALTAESSDLGERLRFALVDLADGAALDRGGSGERLFHVISGRLAAGGKALAAGQTLALAAGETMTPTARQPSRVLVLWV
jgi:5-deoxy-D-glucuronate isomerase